jgi:HlyD family secretion protein
LYLEQTMRKPVILILLILAIVGAGWWIFTTIGRTTAETGASIILYGNVEIREVNLGFRVGGRIADMSVDEGDPVASGQVLASLDDMPYRLELAALDAHRAAAAANLSRLEAGFRPEEIAQAAATLDQRTAALTRTQKDLQRIRSLTASGSATQQDLDRIEAAHDEALASVALARANLDLLQSGFRVEEIAAARAQLEQAKAQVAKIQLQIDDARLHAPAEGTVLVRAQEPGAMVAAGQTVFTLSLQDKTWVRAYVPEPRLGDLHPGMKARIFTDTQPDTPYTGQVGFIASQAEFTPKNVQTEELRSDLVFRFRVVLDNSDEHLRQGMPVTVELVPGD